MSNGNYSKLLWDPVLGDRCELKVEDSFTLNQVRFKVYDDDNRLRAVFALDMDGGKVRLIVDHLDDKGISDHLVTVPLFARD